MYTIDFPVRFYKNRTSKVISDFLNSYLKIGCKKSYSDESENCGLNTESL